MPLDISGLNFFMPVFSFLFVFVIIYAILFKTKVLGESKFILLMVSFVISVVFMSFSSMELFVRTILPWFVVLFVIVFLVLLIAGLSTKNLDNIMTSKFAWVIVSILVIIFLIAAVKVFNPILHPDLIITSGEEGESFVTQLTDFFGSSKVIGSVLLLIIAGIVAWVITRK